MFRAMVYTHCGAIFCCLGLLRRVHRACSNRWRHNAYIPGPSRHSKNRDVSKIQDSPGLHVDSNMTDLVANYMQTGKKARAKCNERGEEASDSVSE